MERLQELIAQVEASAKLEQEEEAAKKEEEEKEEAKEETEEEEAEKGEKEDAETVDPFFSAKELLARVPKREFLELELEEDAEGNPLPPTAAVPLVEAILEQIATTNADVLVPREILQSQAAERREQMIREALRKLK